MIRLATLEDVTETTKSRGVTWQGDVALDSCYMVEQGRAKMLFTLIVVPDGVETHICCPADYVKQSRSMARELIEFAKYIGYSKLYTTAAPQYKTAHNMAKKLGFTKAGCVNGEIVYALQLG